LSEAARTAAPASATASLAVVSAGPQAVASPAEAAPPRAGFHHLHAGHCESGVTAALFAHGGLPIDEPMVFGIGSGVFFLHAPFLKVMGIPLTSYRTYPMAIFRKTCKRLGVDYKSRRFLSRARARAALDALVDSGVPVALQGNLFWLSYFPREFRFQFNGHNFLVVGRSGDDYVVSDPVLEAPVLCPSAALDRARFARGPLAPRGLLYYPVSFPKALDYRPAIRAALKDTCRAMLRTPVPLAGVRGIRYLARQARLWPKKLTPEKTRLFLGNIVRMQEEVGTGGGGFRYMYAAFLQRAGETLGHDPLLRASEMMTASGDAWRRFAEGAALVVKERHEGRVTLDGLADRLADIAEGEHRVFTFIEASLPPA
jgi:hypothetical protein